MASVYVRRFLFDPGNSVLLNIESVNILDLTPPGSISGIGTGVVMIVGEFENGPFNTPVSVNGASDLSRNWGTLGYTYGGVQGNNPCAVARYADNTLAAENWNGNAFVQLNGKQFAQLVVCRANTSVGSVTLTPRAYITGNAAFRYFLAPGDVLGLDVGAGPQTATFSATAATVTGAAATFASITAGMTATLGYDGAPNFVVTFLAGDTTIGNVIARINQYAGFAFATNNGGQVQLTGVQQGNQGQVRVVSGSTGTLTDLGLTVATTFGTGNVANIQAVTAAEITAIVQAAVANTAVEIDANGALRISKTTALASDWVYVTAATTTNVQNSLGFVPGQQGSYLGVGFVLSSVQTYPTTSAGTITLAVDDNFGARGVNGGVPFNVSITLTESLANVVAAINTAAGATVAYVDSTGQLALVGKLPGGRVNVIGASAAPVLAQLGLTVGIYNGAGMPIGLIPAGTMVQDTGAQHVFVTMQDVVSATTGVTIGGVAQPTLGPWTVPVRHAVDNTLGLGASAGAITIVPNPVLLFSLACVNGQAISAALTDAQIDAAYVTALNSTLDINTVAKTVNVVYSARQSNTVRKALRSNVLNASANGCFGRMAVVRPPLGTTKTLAMSSTAEPGVGAYRDQRVIYTWPQANTFVPIIGARGSAGGTGFSYNGNVDVGADGFMASILSQLPPEENPGQETPFATAINSVETSANAQGLVMNDYINLKAQGIAALRMDQGTAIFQSGVTSVDPNIYPQFVRISRRRMADFIQDSLAQLASGFGKKLSTNARRKALAGEIRAFMESLLNKGNPNGQRIAGFTVDDVSGNTPDTLAQGIFRIIINVRTLPSLDSIVLQTTIGEQVQVQEVFPQAA